MTLQISDKIDQISDQKNKVFSILREYQITAVNESIESLENKIDTLLQSPTGSGKTLMMVAIALENLAKGKRVGLLIHKEELLNQWVRNFLEWLPNDCLIGIIGDKSRYGKFRDNSAPLQIMMAKSLSNSDKPKLDLLILDEAHHASAPGWMEIIEYYKENNTQIFGATATPKRLDGKPLTQFKKLIPGPQGSELIDKGHLVPLEIYASRYAINSDNFKIKLGDYDQKTSSRAIAKINPEDIFREWLFNIGPGKLTVVYSTSVDYSKLLSNYFNFQMPGISKHIDSKTSYKERKRILDDFAKGKIQVLFQHSIIIEGIDIPKIEAVICLRPTASISIWLQILGRGLRPAEGKEKLILLDFTDNHLKLPLISDDIIWDLEGQEKIENIAHCPVCNFSRRFNITNRIDHGIYFLIEKSCSKCGFKFSSKKFTKRERTPDTYRSLFTGTIFKKILPKRHFDFSVKPNLLDFRSEGKSDRENFYEFIATTWEHNKKENTSGLSGLMEVVKAWYSQNNSHPTDDILLLAYDAFISSKNPKILSLPDREIDGLSEKIEKAKKEWLSVKRLLATEITPDVVNGKYFLKSQI